MSERYARLIRAWIKWCRPNGNVGLPSRNKMNADLIAAGKRDKLKVRREYGLAIAGKQTW